MYELFDSIIIGNLIEPGTYLLCLLTAGVCGVLTALAASFRSHATKSFLSSLILLPMIVCTVIAMVNGNIGTGVAVMGAFSLIRFRSVPGKARDIVVIFLAMTAGLACAGGYVGIALLFTAIVSLGMFDVGAVNCYSYKQGWRHMSNRNDQGALTLQLDASVMTVVYKQENNAICGAAEVWVDGKLKATLNSNSANAWGNPATEMIFLGKSDAPHTVELRMAPGSEFKTFNLLDIGYAP